MAIPSKKPDERVRRLLISLSPARVERLDRVAEAMMKKGAVPPEKGAANRSGTIGYLIDQAEAALPKPKRTHAKKK